MSSKPIAAHELRALWQRLPTATVVVSAAEMRGRAEHFRRHIWRRNAIEYCASAIVCVSFAGLASRPVSTLWSAGCILIALACLFVAFSLHRRSQSLAREAAPSMALLDFHRSQLERERDMLRGMWRWHLLPLAPGLLLFVVAAWDFCSKFVPRSALLASAAVAVLATVLATVWTVVVQLSGAARLQRMIEDLDRHREQQ